MTAQIKDGTVTIDGVLYKAFENSISHRWYIVIGERCTGQIVARNIEAKSATKALKQWIAEGGPK